MTLAEQVKTAIGDSNTFTIYGGYCLVAGETVRFPTGVPELEKHNEKGQMSHARYIYADGSRLTYRRKPDNEFTLTAGE